MVTGVVTVVVVVVPRKEQPDLGCVIYGTVKPRCRMIQIILHSHQIPNALEHQPTRAATIAHCHIPNAQNSVSHTVGAQ